MQLQSKLATRNADSFAFWDKGTEKKKKRKWWKQSQQQKRGKSDF